MIIKSILVLVIMAVMVLVLLGIGHFLTGDFSASQRDADRLRNDVDKKKDVITDNSAFHSLVKGHTDSGKQTVK